MALEQLCSVLKVLLVTVLVVEGIAVAQKTQDGQNIGMKHVPATQCGIWVRTSNGGHFASPNYPDSYPPNKECIYILEAAPRQRIELTFDEHYYIEPSFECRFDHLEIRDGPFGFSPLIDRYCGVKSPPLIRSTGRFMWIKFSSDEELEGLGFRAKYSFIPDPDFTYLGGILNPIPDCQFELSGADGIVRSSQVEQEEKTKPGQAVDCIWTIKATPKAKIYLRFLDYQMEHSNECKRNFVAVYDGSSSIENLKAKFCSTVANDVMLKTGVGVIRMWADEGSRLSRFRMLFTSFVELLLVTVLVVEGIAVAQKTQDGQNIGMKHVPATQCGIWVRTSNGGHFASPNYPDSYPPNKECIYILEAAPRQRIELTFDEHYYIEPSFECRFDHLEIRDGPFGFSPLIDRYCGVKSPPLIRSTGRFMWIKFSSDEELEGLGFRAKYSFIPDPDFTYLGGILNPIPDCQFELSGADGIVRSSQVEQEEKTKPGQAVDCIWTIKATPKAKEVKEEEHF